MKLTSVHFSLLARIRSEGKVLEKSLNGTELLRAHELCNAGKIRKVKGPVEKYFEIKES